MPWYPETRSSILPPKEPSVFDSYRDRILRTLGTIAGADDPAGTMMGSVGPLTAVAPAAGGPLGALASKAGQAAKGYRDRVIRAFHGSPHDFDQFSMSKIGTGEGAQAYGHGLYFAENPQTAQAYREKLSSDAGGKMYEVNIHADPDQFLDWDAPISKQSPTVRAALERIEAQSGYTLQPVRNIDGTYSVTRAKSDGAGQINYEIREATPEAALARGRAWALETPAPTQYRELGRGFDARSGPIAASDKLRQAGIPGIKYLDQGSRGAGEGTRNYVVFDDKLVSIVKKYVAAGMAFHEAVARAQAEVGQK